jgi:hypothetical protein
MRPDSVPGDDGIIGAPGLALREDGCGITDAQNELLGWYHGRREDENTFGFQGF